MQDATPAGGPSTGGRPAILLRSEVVPRDVERVEAIVRSTGVFREEEIATALELVRERLRIGAASGYEFVFAEVAGEAAGYACFGPIPCTVHSFDLYWIATERARMGRGVGRLMLQAVERAVAARGGSRIYVETSSTAAYAPTRAFYARCGYAVEAVLADFYAPGDSKVVLLKILA